MATQLPPGHCLNCFESIHQHERRFSVNFMGHALCATCQSNLKTSLKESSRETAKLYFSLKQRGIPAVLEKATHLKGVDIAVNGTQLNIEVDTPLHTCHPEKALAELKQVYYSADRGFFTLHIPNALVAYNLEQTADTIASLVKAKLPAAGSSH
jgi:very-short-patch-repair endonuclease